jgi:type II secretory pathway component PulM
VNQIRMHYAGQARLTFIVATLLSVAAVVQLGITAYESLSTARMDLERLERLVALPAPVAGTDDQDIRGLAIVANPSEAGSAMQAALNRSAEAHGFKIENLQLLEPERNASLTLFALRANGVIPEQSALPLMAELANAQPAIFVRKVEIQKVPEMALLEDESQKQDRLLALRFELVSAASIEPARPTAP